jgi:hypothetical protein
MIAIETGSLYTEMYCTLLAISKRAGSSLASVFGYNYGQIVPKTTFITAL